MKHYGLNIAEGSSITNITIPTGVSFPSNDNVGELFYRTDQDVFYVRDNTTWAAVATGSGIASVIEDLSPQLGGILDVNDFSIISKAPVGVTADAGDIAIIGNDGGATSGNGGDINITAGKAFNGASGNIILEVQQPTSGTLGTIELKGRVEVQNQVGGVTAALVASGPTPQLRINRTGAAADTGKWAIRDFGGGYLDFSGSNDAESGGSSYMRIHRSSGTSVDQIELFDVLRGPPGSNGIPAYSFYSSTDSGMFYDNTASSDGPSLSSNGQRVTVFTDTGMRIKKLTAPSTDVSGFGYIYLDATDNVLKFRTDTGAISLLSTTEISADVTPQLGGNLETNGNNIVVATGDIITITDAPVSATDGANKSYVDSISAGLDPKASVRVATTAALPAVTPAGTGVGKTLTANAVGIVAVDGQDLTAANSFVVGDRILIKDQASAIDNGIYTITTLSDVAVALVLTRAEDFDGTPSNEVSGGNFTFAEEGTTNVDTGWVVTANGAIILDTDAVTWTQYTGAGSFTTGLGLDQSGSTIFIKSSELASATITTADTVSFFDNDGTTSSTDAGDRKTTIANFISDLSIVTGSALANVVEDTTPQLGGDLDTNGSNIITAGTSGGTNVDNMNIAVGDVDGSGAAGQLNITGSDISAIGTTLNAGNVTITGGGVAKTTATGFAGNVTIRGGGATSPASGGTGGDVTIEAGDGSGTGGSVNITPGAGSSNTAVVILPIDGSLTSPMRFRELIANGQNFVQMKAPLAVTTSRTWVLPQDDPATVNATGQFLTSDASGNLSFADVDGGTF